MYEIAVRGQFSAAHRLEGHRGKCSRLHGHTWIVEAVFAADEVDESGLVVDFDEARASLEEVIEPFDHSYLNEVEPFETMPPTAENVARTLFERLRDRADLLSWPARLQTVKVWESEGAWASFSGD